jgi:hypothetical protein
LVETQAAAEIDEQKIALLAAAEKDAQETEAAPIVNALDRLDDKTTHADLGYAPTTTVIDAIDTASGRKRKLGELTPATVVPMLEVAPASTTVVFKLKSKSKKRRGKRKLKTASAFS